MSTARDARWPSIETLRLLSDGRSSALLDAHATVPRPNSIAFAPAPKLAAAKDNPAPRAIAIGPSSLVRRKLYRSGRSTALGATTPPSIERSVRCSSGPAGHTRPGPSAIKGLLHRSPHVTWLGTADWTGSRVAGAWSDVSDMTKIAESIAGTKGR